jgi:hypothetical protein
MKLHRLFMVALALTLAVAAFAPVRAQDDSGTKTLFITEDGRMSVELPEGWFATGSVDSLEVANNEALLTSEDIEVTESGSLAFVVLPLPKADIEAFFGIPADSSLLDITTALTPIFLEDDGSVTISEPEQVDETVVRLTLSDEINDGVIYVADNFAPDAVGIILMIAPTGEMTEDAEFEILGIASTIQFGLDLTTAYTAADGSLSFSHPDGWIAQDIQAGFAGLYDSQETADAAAAQADTTEGEVRLVVGAFDRSAEEITDDVLLAEAADLAAQIAADSEHNPVLGDAVFVESESLTQRVVFVEATSDIAAGGLVLVYDAETGIASVVIYAGGLDVGDRVFQTALNIALTATPGAGGGEVAPAATAEVSE